MIPPPYPAHNDNLLREHPTVFYADQGVFSTKFVLIEEKNWLEGVWGVG